MPGPQAGVDADRESGDGADILEQLEGRVPGKADTHLSTLFCTFPGFDREAGFEDRAEVLWSGCRREAHVCG